MNFSGLFIRRPIGTLLLACGLAIFGAAAFFLLPVAPLPQVEYPTISVKAQLPGADPVTVAKSLTTPLEKQLGHIAGLKMMTSSSMLGSSNIVLQFELDRDINSAARDVQAAIDAAKGNLPPDMPLHPTYTKSNPSDPPLMLLSLTSETATRAQMYEVASTLLQQKLMQVEGVGDVTIGGGALPSVRVELDPDRLNQYHLSLEAVRAFLRGANVHQALGSLSIAGQSYSLDGPQALLRAADFRPLALPAANGAVLHLADFAQVEDSVEDTNNYGITNGKPAILLVVFKQPGANVIEAVKNVKRQLPQLAAAIPADIHIDIVGDRTTAILAALDDVEITLIASILLVVVITFAFFRDWRAALVPAVAVPLSLLGTFAAMYFLGFSLNILSLMALAISTGFVVDDAIVVTENVMRRIERGETPLHAALEGTREIAFTVVSISISLLAIFIPLLFMGGLIGRLFREFSVSMATAVFISMVLSLSLTPVLIRLLARPRAGHADNGAQPRRETALARAYERSLHWALEHRALTLGIAAATVALNAALLLIIPKGFFPQEDIDKITGVLVAPQDIAFPELQAKLKNTVQALRSDPDVDSVVGFVGVGQLSHLGTVYVYLNKRGQRRASADQVIEHLRARVESSAGVRIYLQSSQNFVINSRRSAAQFQFTLKAGSLEELNTWGGLVTRAMRGIPELTQVNSNRSNRGLERYVEIDRHRAERLGVNVEALDQTLYDAFGQRRVSTIYQPANQFRVVMEVAPEFRTRQDALEQIKVPASKALPGATTLVPLSQVASFRSRTNYLLVSHTDQYPSETISFNLAPGVSLSTATQKIQDAIAGLHLPAGVVGQFSGSAQAFQESMHSTPWLVAAAIVAMYIVLGMLYESFLHPLTILSTLPSAGVGALLALLLCRTELSIIACIGIVLLVGIVTKNAIMLIDFALEQERHAGVSSAEAIRHACKVRLRPILMTTAAAVLGAVPLLLGSGYGSEFRRPLGLVIIGGLVASQLLTLYTTPAVYLSLAGLRARYLRAKGAKQSKALPGTPGTSG